MNDDVDDNDFKWTFSDAIAAGKPGRISTRLRGAGGHGAADCFGE